MAVMAIIAKSAGTVLAMVAAAVLVTGCNRDGPQAGETKITLMTFEWPTGDFDYRYRQDLFNEQHDDVYLEILNVPPTTYITKLWASVAGGIAPDIFYSMTGRHKQFLARGAFQPLNKYIYGPDGLDLDDFNTTVIQQQLSRDGQIYAIPQAADCLALYYNKDLFEKYGIPPLSETEPITWEYYREIATKLTRDLDGDGHTDQFGTVPGFDNTQPTYFFYVFHASYGGQAYTEDGSRALFDRQESVEALTYLHDLVHRYNCAPTPSVGQQIGRQLFPANRLGMFVNGPWVAYEYEQTAPDLNYGVAPVPVREGYPRANYVGGPAVGISASSPNPDEAWQVVKFLVSPQFQKLPIQGLPSRQSVMRDPDFQGFPYVHIFEREIKNGITNFFIEQYDQATVMIQQSVEQILSSPNTRDQIPQIMQNLNSELNRLLAR